ncbi:MAG: hypothetical protein IJC80_03100 [Clostridia bacterium]|nr:hypothetical protein [Clostridia bacterium]
MRYVSPKYDYLIIETEDVLSASGEGYEIEKNDDGSGNVIIDASGIFN